MIRSKWRRAGRWWRFEERRRCGSTHGILGLLLGCLIRLIVVIIFGLSRGWWRRRRFIHFFCQSEPNRRRNDTEVMFSFATVSFVTPCSPAASDTFNSFIGVIAETIASSTASSGSRLCKTRSTYCGVFSSLVSDEFNNCSRVSGKISSLYAPRSICVRSGMVPVKSLISISNCPPSSDAALYVHRSVTPSARISVTLTGVDDTMLT